MRQSSIVRASDRTRTTSGDQNAGASGNSRSAAKVTGSASAAKFVPHRGEKRVGRACPLHDGGQPALLGSGDRAVLRAVQVQRPTAQDR